MWTLLGQKYPRYSQKAFNKEQFSAFWRGYPVESTGEEI